MLSESNINRTFRATSPEVRAAGRDWYRRARTLAEELAAERLAGTGVGPSDPDWASEVSRAAAVIAVLSPRVPWNKNVELTQMAYQLHAVGTWRRDPDGLLAVWPGLKGNAEKAFRILDGEDPDDVVSGPKVRAFWHTISDPTDPRSVVVDRHALDVAAGEVLDDKRRGQLLGRKGAYDNVSQLYRRSARRLSRETGEDWTPAEVQAVTWLRQRETKSRSSASLPAAA